MESERLILEPLTIEELQQILNGEQTFLKESVLSEVIKTAIAKKIERMQEVPLEGHPWLSYWLIKEKSKGQGIGLIGCKCLPDEEGYVELGYAVAKEYRKKGYMTEALENFLDWLYEFPFCKGAILSIRSANIPSIKVAENCDFRYEKMQDIYKIYRYDF